MGREVQLVITHWSWARWNEPDDVCLLVDEKQEYEGRGVSDVGKSIVFCLWERRPASERPLQEKNKKILQVFDGQLLVQGNIKCEERAVRQKDSCSDHERGRWRIVSPVAWNSQEGSSGGNHSSHPSEGWYCSCCQIETPSCGISTGRNLLLFGTWWVNKWVFDWRNCRRPQLPLDKKNSKQVPSCRAGGSKEWARRGCADSETDLRPLRRRAQIVWEYAHWRVSGKCSKVDELPSL